MKKPQASSTADRDRNQIELLDARDNAARRIRFAAKVLSLEVDDPLNDADLGTLSEYLDWVADELKPRPDDGGAE